MNKENQNKNYSFKPNHTYFDVVDDNQPIKDIQLGDYKFGDTPREILKLVPGKTKIFAIVFWNERTQLPEQTTVQDSLSEIEKQNYGQGYQPMHNFVDIEKIAEINPNLLMEFYKNSVFK